MTEFTLLILQRRKLRPEETKKYPVVAVKALGLEPKHLTLENVRPGWEGPLRSHRERWGVADVQSSY